MPFYIAIHKGCLLRNAPRPTTVKQYSLMARKNAGEMEGVKQSETWSQFEVSQDSKLGTMM